MANCLLDTAFAGVGCGESTPGMYDYLYFGNKSEATLTKGTGASLGLVTDITFTSGAGWYKVKCKKGSVVFSEAFTGDGDTVSFAPQFEAHIASNAQDARNFINAIAGPDLIVVGRGKGDTFHIVGVDSGARLVEAEATSATDGFGNRFVVRAIDEADKSLLYLDTNATTTAATLDTDTIES